MNGIKVHKSKLFIYLGLLVLSLIWSFFCSGPFPYSVLFMLILYAPVSLFFILLSNIFIRIHMESGSPRITKGEETAITGFFENSGIIRINDLALETETEISSSTGIENGHLISLVPGEQIKLKGMLRCFYAGCFDTGVLGWNLKDPFDICRVSFKAPQPLRISVRPRITDIANRVLDFENLKNSSGLRSPQKLEHIPANDMRLYLSTDSVRHINWKVSAAKHELYVRKPDPEELFPVTLFLKTRSDDALIRKDMEAVRIRDLLLEFAASAAAWFYRNGWAVTIYLPSGVIRKFQVTGQDSFQEFIDALSDPLFYGTGKEQERLDEILLNSQNSGETLSVVMNETGITTNTFVEAWYAGRNIR